MTTREDRLTAEQRHQRDADLSLLRGYALIYWDLDRPRSTRLAAWSQIEALELRIRPFITLQQMLQERGELSRTQVMDLRASQVASETPEGVDMQALEMEALKLGGSSHRSPSEQRDHDRFQIISSNLSLLQAQVIAEEREVIADFLLTQQVSKTIVSAVRSGRYAV